MPRFGIKRLMVILAAFALWLATFRVPEGANRGVGTEIRVGILLAVLISAGFATLYFRGKRQAFWAGFSVSLLLLYGQFYSECIPNLLKVAHSWSYELRAFHASDRMAELLGYSLWAGLLLSFSAVVGLIVAAIYDQSQSRK
jgi:hypothetical protein